jgi:hypothetical protein
LTRAESGKRQNSNLIYNKLIKIQERFPALACGFFGELKRRESSGKSGGF